MAERQKTLVVIDPDQWETMSINEEYEMESQVFDYEILKQSPDYGIKKFSEAIYRGELKNNKR